MKKFTLSLLLFAFSSQAHGPLPHPSSEDHSFGSMWNTNPFVWISIFLLIFIYYRGLFFLWKKTGRYHGITFAQAFSYGLSILFLVLALVSPIDGLSAELSSIHMIQHMIIMMISAPLFILGAPAYVMLWAFPIAWRKKTGKFFRKAESWKSGWYFLFQPISLWVLFALTLWVWHYPKFYEAALRNDLLHDFQHISFFTAAALFWRVLLDPLKRYRLSPGLGMLYLFTTSLHGMVMGVFMTLSPRAWYSDYESTTQAWSLSALEDQQIAGLVMWMPACGAYAIIASLVCAYWLRESQRGSSS
jgi:putative membrane protein